MIMILTRLTSHKFVIDQSLNHLKKLICLFKMSNIFDGYKSHVKDFVISFFIINLSQMTQEIYMAHFI